MKIVSTELSTRHMGTVRAGIQVAEDFLGWNPTKFPVFDLLDEVKPDVVFIDLKFVTSTMVRAFSENDSIKVVLFGQGVPKNFFPNLVVAMPSTSPVLRKNIESSDYTTLYQHDSANIVDIWGEEANPFLACDIGYIFDDQDPEFYTKQILLASEISKIAQTKIIGTKKISLPNYLGNLSEKSLSGFYKTCKIVIDWKAQHMLDIAANGGFALPTIGNRLYPTLNENNLKEQLEGLLHKEKTRKKNARKSQSMVLENDTCFHRIREIFEHLDMEEGVERTNKLLEERVSCVLESA
jgi:hypothetical protein